MQLKFEDLFKPSVLCMKINRSHPHIKKDLKWFSLFIIIHGPYTVIFIIAIQNIVLNIKANKMSETCKSGTLVVVYIVNTFHYIILLWKQTVLFGLMEDMETDFIKSNQLPNNEQEMIHKYARMGAYVCNQWFWLTCVGTLLFPIQNLGLIIHSWSKGEFHYVPLFDLVYPWAYIEENKDSLLVFIITYIPILLFASYSSSLYTAFVPLGPTFMLHACGQLEVVRTRVDGLFKNNDVREVQLQLKDIVQRLQYIYGFVDRAKLCFRLVYEVTMKGTTIIVPIVCYEILESLKHGEVSLDFFVFIVGGILISSAPCYYSDLLMEKGEDLCLSIYFCGWERRHERGLRSTLLVMLQRAQRPVAIQSLFRVVCLDALTDVFQQAYTIFNLLNASTN